MAKRFCDTELSDKEWFMTLSCRLKCVVRYLFDKCDNAGVWTPNYTLGTLYVGEAFTESDILKIDRGQQFEKFKDKIFISSFCSFQYGELKENCNPHRAIIQKLKKYGLYDRVLEGYFKGTGRVQEKEQEQDKEEDKEEGVVGEGFWINEISKEMELTILEVSNVKEFIKIVCQKTITDVDVGEHWKAFKLDNFGKKEWYGDREKLVSHFRHTLKNQLTNKNGTHSSNNAKGDKPGTSEARVTALQNWSIGGKVFDGN